METAKKLALIPQLIQDVQHNMETTVVCEESGEEEML
jgi:hypothetical protein